MRIGAIVLKLRIAQTHFKNFIGGSSEMQHARNQTLVESAFVVPLIESAEENKTDSDVEQKLTERFAVIVALKNDRKLSDRYSFVAIDMLHDIRNQFFTALLGWEMPDAESKMRYRGGQILDVRRDFLWWQFEFEFDSRIERDALTIKGVEAQTEDIFNASITVSRQQAGLQTNDDFTGKTAEEIQAVIRDPDVPFDFNTLYAQFLQAPSADLPFDGTLPREDGFPDVFIPDMAQFIDMKDHPDDGDYGLGFATAFDFFKQKNRSK